MINCLKFCFNYAFNFNLRRYTMVKHIETFTGVGPAILAFSLGSDGIHSPNEFFPVARFALAGLM